MTFSIKDVTIFSEHVSESPPAEPRYAGQARGSRWPPQGGLRGQAFSVVTGGRATCFRVLSTGEAPAPSNREENGEGASGPR